MAISFQEPRLAMTETATPTTVVPGAASKAVGLVPGRPPLAAPLAAMALWLEQKAVMMGIQKVVMGALPHAPKKRVTIAPVHPHPRVALCVAMASLPAVKFAMTAVPSMAMVAPTTVWWKTVGIAAENLRFARPVVAIALRLALKSVMYTWMLFRQQRDKGTPVRGSNGSAPAVVQFSSRSTMRTVAAGTVPWRPAKLVMATTSGL